MAPNVDGVGWWSSRSNKRDQILRARQTIEMAQAS
jgi:hypothetical protein